MKKEARALALGLFFAIGGLSAKANIQQQNPGNINTLNLSADTPSAELGLSFSSEQLVYKNRLDSIQGTVPLTYNSFVQKYIDIYASRSKQIAKVLGLSKYYFPMFDEGFKQYNIPEEIKFLSIVESSLDPLAVSKSGAAGQWQFMPTTAAGYGLNIDEYVDQRRDPVAASLAAANYLRDAYTVLGDWLLAIASYNCGQGAVTRAIKKAGNVYDFWAIRKFLPIETQNYVPAFIATTYIMNYYSKHNIVPTDAEIPVNNDVLQVDRFISLSTIAKAADVDLKQLSILNPSYKRDIINGSAMAPKNLVLPTLVATAFQAVYEVLNGAEAQPAFASAPVAAMPEKYAKIPSTLGASKKYLTYKVKPGDTLSEIAQKFEGANVSGIKSHNNLRSSSLKPGMMLKINKG